ncbi:ankyrin repeat-containing protein [Ophiostoma piceae UAMH 11346]|uniref:Ankyrin repeat-containing protein n=1 Tax=Ophiostoma piceae (strain UAMH 11346) TaxID=1262450 RepID=S3DAM6_OPHP1|nr:ankyrin repeat-containing protein [Ophiostoma piceae UAMH 11346]
MAPNQYIMASDNSPELLPLLREKPELAIQQDEHGYSLIHAAASYNHLDLLRTLVNEFKVPVDLRDEDNETALFVVETVEAARCLIEELKLDPTLVGDEGRTAADKIAEDGDFPEVAEYLSGLQAVLDAASEVLVDGTLPPPPEGMTVTMGAAPASEVEGGSADGEDVLPADPEFRRRIEELAARPDFHTDAGQAELRRLVEDALLGRE